VSSIFLPALFFHPQRRNCHRAAQHTWRDGEQGAGPPAQGGENSTTIRALATLTRRRCTEKLDPRSQRDPAESASRVSAVPLTEGGAVTHDTLTNQPNVATDSLRGQRSALIVAIAVTTVMVPWCLYLAATLPSRAIAEHWSVAWAGLDAAQALCAGFTVFLLRRHRPQASLTATLGAGLLLADAWFDVTTAAPGADQLQAVLAAALIEGPLAVLALWFAWTNLTRLIGRMQAVPSEIAMPERITSR